MEGIIKQCFSVGLTPGDQAGYSFSSILLERISGILR